MNKVDPETVRAMLAAAEEGHKKALADLTEAQERLQAYAASVGGLRAWLTLIDKEGPPAAKGAPDLILPRANGDAAGWEPAYVRPREAILRLFDETRDWSLAEIETAMRERKWLDPSLARPTEAIRAAANRLVEVDRKLTRIGKSSYRKPIDLLAEIAIPEARA